MPRLVPRRLCDRNRSCNCVNQERHEEYLPGDRWGDASVRWMMPMPNSSARWPYHVAGWTFAVLCVGLVALHRHAAALIMSDHPIPAYVLSPSAASEVAWFRQMKPYCNTVEVESVARRAAPPATPAGSGYYAACFALAGRIDDARRIIDKLNGDA